MLKELLNLLRDREVGEVRRVVPPERRGWGEEWREWVGGGENGMRALGVALQVHLDVDVVHWRKGGVGAV